MAIVMYSCGFTFAVPGRKGDMLRILVIIPTLLLPQLSLALARDMPVALLCRRMVFERVLRDTATAQNGLTLISGHVDTLLQERGRATGMAIDGNSLSCDVVVDASGRSSKFTGDVRPPAEGGDCGAVYVTRQYRLRDGAGAGPVNSPIGLSLAFAGYFAIAFVHDSNTFSITFTHDGSEKRLRRLRHDDVFDDAVRAIPQLADWIEPSRSQPISAALPGGRNQASGRGCWVVGSKEVIGEEMEPVSRKVPFGLAHKAHVLG